MHGSPPFQWYQGPDEKDWYHVPQSASLSAWRFPQASQKEPMADMAPAVQEDRFQPLITPFFITVRTFEAT